MKNTMRVVAIVLLLAIVCNVSSAIGDALKSKCLGCFKGSATYETADEGFKDKFVNRLKDNELVERATDKLKKMLNKKEREDEGYGGGYGKEEYVEDTYDEYSARLLSRPKMYKGIA